MKRVIDWGKWSRRANTGVAALALLFAAGLIVYYIWFPSWGYFHADCADTILWAEATWDAGSLLNPDFAYACLLPFGGQLLMAPFIGLFGVSTTAQAIGMTLFLLLFIGALAALFRTMRWPAGWTMASIALILLTVSSSDKLREIFWGHIIYYSLGMLFLFAGLALAFLTLRSLDGMAEDNIPGRRQFLLLGATGLWFLLCSMNGLQALTIFALPAIAGVAGERFLDTKQDGKAAENRRAYWLIGSMTVGTVLGILLGQLIGQGMSAGYATAYSSFDDSTAWWDNLGRLIPHWMTLLGVSVRNGDAFMTEEGFLNLLRLLFGIVLAVVPVVMLFFYRKLDKPLKILLLAHWTMTALILAAFVFGLLSSADWRLSPLVCSGMLLLTAFARWMWTRQEGRRFVVLPLIPAAIFCLMTASAIGEMPADYGRDTGLNAVADYLEEQGLTYGYGTFWNAGSVTVLSDSEVTVRSVKITGSGCEPDLYQTNANWYTPQDGQETYFLLLTATEYREMQSGGNPLLEQATGHLSCQGYEILLLDFCPVA